MFCIILTFASFYDCQIANLIRNASYLKKYERFIQRTIWCCRVFRRPIFLSILFPQQSARRKFQSHNGLSDNHLKINAAQITSVANMWKYLWRLGLYGNYKRGRYISECVYINATRSFVRPTAAELCTYLFFQEGSVFDDSRWISELQHHQHIRTTSSSSGVEFRINHYTHTAEDRKRANKNWRVNKLFLCQAFNWWQQQEGLQRLMNVRNRILHNDVIPLPRPRTWSSVFTQFYVSFRSENMLNGTAAIQQAPFWGMTNLGITITSQDAVSRRVCIFLDRQVIVM